MQLHDVEDFYPLSPLQGGLLFHTLSEPDSRMYFNQTLATLRGDLDLAAFESAWQLVIDRHPILRSFFVWEGVQQPVQVVARQAVMPLAVEDWRDLEVEERQQHLDALRHADLEQGFDLARAPLMRGWLLRTAEDRHDLFWSFHHILMDGWSMFAVLGQVFAAYDAAVAGRSRQLTSPRRYREHIAWLARQDLSAAEAFWRRTLSGFSVPTALPFEPAQQPPESGAEEFLSRERWLSAATSRAIESLAHTQHVTVNTLLQGAWALLLGRHAGERDVVFGTVVSGRPAELQGVDKMVGLFINTLPVRVPLPPDEDLGPWLRHCQSIHAEMREYEYSPLVEVQNWSEVPRGLGLFESIFLFENYHKESSLEEMCHSLQITDVQWFERHNFPLAALAIPGEQMQLKLIYQSDHFTPQTIDRLLGHWSQLLSGMVANPQATLGELTLTTPEEVEQLLRSWSGQLSDSPREATIQQLFEEQVDRRPAAVALCWGEQTMSYAELDRRANRLAHRLRRLGVGPETPVGLYLRRSPELPVAILAVLKAGGAYLPLDPDYPAERLALMLDDTRPAALLTQSSLAASLPTCDAPTLCLDDEAAASLADESEQRLPATGRAEQLAYLIYTSGSTGRPKGTMVPHRAVTRLVKQTDFARFDEQLVMLQFATVSFDASTLELWGSLLNGGRLVLFPPGKPSLEDIGRVVHEQGVNMLWLTAGLFHQLVDHDPMLLRGVTQLLAGGDVLSVAHVNRALQALDGCTLINGYGPTENTTFTCCHSMTAATAPRRTVPIGRPIAQTTVYILDQGLRPVPVGVAGDLHTGGDGLSRGYLGHPALTAERFLPDPFSSRPGARMYATGDQARWLADGTVEFLGRNDRQIKLRGFRIELGEIEVTLAGHEAVADTVLMAREDTPGDKRLVAYVVVVAGERPRPEALRGFLAERLPEYMLPSFFVVLDAFPLTANGKVDRDALPAPEGSRPELETAFIAPEAGVEATIAAIWQEALGLTRVGVQDNFFDLGGHSLHLIAVHGKLKAALGAEIPMVEMFRYPTVAALARRLEQGGEAPAPAADDEGQQQRQAGRQRLARMQRRRRGSGH